MKIIDEGNGTYRKDTENVYNNNLVVTLGNGVPVQCRQCGKLHIIGGYTGNNEAWEDKKGWTGNFDVCRGPFFSHSVDSYCPKHDPATYAEYVAAKAEKYAEEF